LARTVEVRSPSFPEVKSTDPIIAEMEQRWQVLCGDKSHWRTGIYSPNFSSPEEIEELERHSCPELFLLLDGAVTLLVEENKELKKIDLEQGKPVLVKSWHSGYCPNGPHTGRVFVVERDEFITEYRSVKDLTV